MGELHLTAKVLEGCGKHYRTAYHLVHEAVEVHRPCDGILNQQVSVLFLSECLVHTFQVIFAAGEKPHGHNSPDELHNSCGHEFL